MQTQALIEIVDRSIGDESVQTVNARDLHAFLENKDHFATWVKDRVAQYGFVQGLDFTTYSGNSEKGRPSLEYAVSIEMAKELAMVERTSKGKEARQYFIECERRARAVAPAVNLNDPAFLRTMLLGYTEQVLALQATVAEQAPKAEFHDKYAVSTGNKGFREVCKLLKANEREFREFLIAEDVMYRLGGKMMPKAPHLVTGRFEVKAGIDEETGHAFNQAKFTPKGITWVAGEWAKFNLARVEAAIEDGSQS